MACAQSHVMHEGQKDNAMNTRQSEQSALNQIRMLYALRCRTAKEDVFMNKLAKDYLNSSLDAATARRRAYDLLRIAAGTA